jgi:bile acid-coenzyme A ligase
VGADEGIPYGRRLTDLADELGDATALVVAAADGSEQAHGWRALERRANQVARRLARAGVGEGDLVAVGLPSNAEHVVTTFAAWKLGAAVLPLRPELPGWERDRLLALAEPRLLVGDWPDAPAGALTLADVRATTGEDDTPPPGDPVPPYARLIATSGSTGTPKIIVAPSPARYVAAGPGVIPAGQRVLAVCPLYHANGYASCYATLLAGDPVVLVERFDAARVVDLIERHRVSAAIMVPTMLQRIARLDGVRERDFSSLQRVVYGAAVLPEWVARTWLDLVPPERFLFTYGGSEGLGIVACTGREWLDHPGTTGRGTDCDVAVRDAAGRDLPPGEIGEIWLRLRSGDTDPFRYVGARTPEPVEGGWRSFGDMGRLDADGYLYIADRRQDMIVTGGVNVFPAEVEAALSEHPEVADVAVIGVPDPEWQRAVHAVVQPRSAEQPPTAGELRAWCKERLSGPKVPKSYEFVDELPRTSAGKINRTRLAAERAPAAG